MAGGSLTPEIFPPLGMRSPELPIGNDISIEPIGYHEIEEIANYECYEYRASSLEQPDYVANIRVDEHTFDDGVRTTIEARLMPSDKLGNHDYPKIACNVKGSNGLNDEQRKSSVRMAAELVFKLGEIKE